tara:strand:+ start:650 stop:820 length:171 start_codon:yes stop_codon:yes gene_type:complete
VVEENMLKPFVVGRLAVNLKTLCADSFASATTKRREQERKIQRGKAIYIKESGVCA